MTPRPWNSLGQNTGVGSLSLLQGIFPTQGLNPGLPHCQRILYQQKLEIPDKEYMQYKYKLFLLLVGILWLLNFRERWISNGFRSLGISTYPLASSLSPQKSVHGILLGICWMEEDEGRVIRKEVLRFRDLDRIIVGSYPCFSSHTAFILGGL